MNKLITKPIVLFGPSGSGKSTLLAKLFDEFPGQFSFVVSHTTRQPRQGEQHGAAYYFVTKDEFTKMIQNQEFIEHAEFSGNHYGTSIKAVEDVEKLGKICILDIEINGVRQVKRSRLNPRFLYISPPSLDVLKQRLLSRGTETEESLKKRLDTAVVEQEFANTPNAFDSKIINLDLDTAYKQFKEFIFGDC
ncbi:hypothetical protein BB561_004263 [Smittium simulii]|uniref:Guanylate kinase n=1 Tax=Smittium simulii TaxID=133385 RepID=A0A2T9YH35_9FUNG|nr:hypothetical protein BB561_004263 [Smittium simulii]